MPHGVIFRGNLLDWIVRAPEMYGQVGKRSISHLREGSICEADRIGKDILINTTYRWGGETVSLQAKRCEEHDCVELIPTSHYWRDLRPWYAVGRHPRFSLLNALRKIGRQGVRDTDRIMWRLSRPDRSSDGPKMKGALRDCHEPRDFIRRIKPYLRTRLRIGRRQLNVTREFAERFHKRSFTVQDFLNQENQELRRIIARFVPIPKVVARMKLIGKDKEGAIYEEKVENRRYLHVICPSTKQDYLLEIPRQVENGVEPLNPNDQVGERTRWKDLVSPAEARRWTFDLPADVEFAKEA